MLVRLAAIQQFLSGRPADEEDLDSVTVHDEAASPPPTYEEIVKESKSLPSYSEALHIWRVLLETVVIKPKNMFSPSI